MWVRGLKLMTHSMKRMTITVAPYVGAWIETALSPTPYRLAKSHPMWVRGLKQLRACILRDIKRSHPMWVRGLKHH